MEEPAEKETVEGVELVMAKLCLHLSQFVFKIIHIAVKEWLFLNKVNEHEPIEHHGRVPLLIIFPCNSLNKSPKILLLSFELIIKTFGDTVPVGCITQRSQNIEKPQFFFVFNINRNVVKLLDNYFKRLIY